MRWCGQQSGLTCFVSDDDRSFLFDIVANNRNGVDVDKFDYIQRDCYYTGVKSSYDPSRFLHLLHSLTDATLLIGR